MERSPFSIMVRNLNYDTEIESVRAEFESCGSITRVSPDSCEKGFVFIDFEDQESVDSALVKNQTELNGRTISVVDTKAPREGAKGQGGASKNVFIRYQNMDFTKEQFEEDFANHGEVSRCTLLMDRDSGEPKGYFYKIYDLGSFL